MISKHSKAPINVAFTTYPWAFHIVGGGEIQLQMYEKYLPLVNVAVHRHDPWSHDYQNSKIFHFFSCMPGQEFFVRYLKSIGKRIVITSSLWIDERNKEDFDLGKIAEFLNLADAIVVNSQLERETLSRILVIDKQRFTVVYNGVESCFLETGKDELRVEGVKSPPKIVCVANIERRKNQKILIKATKNLGLPLCLVGNVREKDYWLSCQEIAHPNLILEEQVAYGDTRHRQLMREADLFVLPSLLETPGLAALEAFVGGARVAITQIGSAPEYFGDLVSYIDPHDVASVTKAIKLQLTLPRNTATQRQAIFDRFNWHTASQQLADLYYRLSI